jgi:hypothetical protein
MKLIFADNTELEILNILGQPEYIQNFNRDVLTIEVDPKVADLNKLQEMFHDTKKTKKLTTHEIRKEQALVETDEVINEETGEKKKEMQEVEKEVTTVIGEYYTLYLGCMNEITEVKTLTVAPSSASTREVNKVRLGQLTHTEMQLEKMKEFMMAQGFQL